MKSIYKLIYPNGKIYIYSDLEDRINYFGDADNDLVERDFSKDDKKYFTVRKTLLWESDIASDGEVKEKEIEYIRFYRSDNPEVGYNKYTQVN